MKKWILLINLSMLTMLMLLFATPSFAINTPNASNDYSGMCSDAYDVSSTCCQVTSKYSGMTFLTEQIVQMAIRRELKKATKEKFKVEMKSFSAKDLAQGRFKSLKISGKNLDIDGFYITALEAKTLCPFNYIELVKGGIKFKENMVMSFSTVISDTDLRKTVHSAGYLDKVNKISLSALGITFFKLSGADVEIKNNKLYFTVKVTSPLSSSPVPIVVRSDLKVEDGNIVLTKIDLVNLFTVIDASRITYLLNALNPLTFSTEILNNKASKINVKNVDIIGDRIIIKGNVIMPKNSYNK